MSNGMIERQQSVQQVVVVDEPRTCESVLGQVMLIQDVMKSVMRNGEHYGAIPGCGDKPTLLLPGAQKLTLTFQWAPQYHIETRDLAGGHREYSIRCVLTSRSGAFVGEGVGACSTMESKYRYRTETVGNKVPPAYWESRDPKLLGGPDHFVKKRGSQWQIMRRVEHDNPADYYNTALKIGKKRAYVDAVLTATAASDIFTHDLEDIKANMEVFASDDHEVAEQPVANKPTASRGKGEVPPRSQVVNPERIKNISLGYKSLYGSDRAQAMQWVQETAGREFDPSNPAQWTTEDCEKCEAALEAATVIDAKAESATV